MEALSKVTTTKDINNRTIMQIICERMKQEEGEDFVNIKNGFTKVYWVTGYNLKEEESKVGEMKGNLQKVLSEYNTAVNPEMGDRLDKYCMDRK